MRRDWTAGPIAVALCAALAIAGAVWLMWTADPVLTLLAGIWAATTGLCVLAATRNLRAELDAARRLLDAYNSSEARDDLSTVGPVSPPAGVRHVHIDTPGDDDDPEPAEFMDLIESTDTPRGQGLAHLAEVAKVHGPMIVTPEMARDLGAFHDEHGKTWTLSPSEPMTVAETDRLVAQLQALPGEDVIESTDIPRGQGLARLAEVAQRLAACQGGDPDRIICTDTSCPGHGLVIDGPHHREAVARDGEGCICPRDGEGERLLARYPACPGHGQYFARPDGALHLGQPCNVCDAPSTAWISDRPDPEISDVTFLCDEHYADRMSEEDGR